MKYLHHVAEYAVQGGACLKAVCRLGGTVQGFGFACFFGAILSLVLWGLFVSGHAFVTEAEVLFAAEPSPGTPRSQLTADLILEPDIENESS